MSGSKARLEAIDAVKNYQPPAQSSLRRRQPGEIFGENVFTKAVMQKRLPKPVFKSLMATIEHSKPLDPTVADVVAAAMKDWAMEKGATHYAHVFYPSDPPHRREARQLLRARRRRFRHRRVPGQDADPGRARRLELPQRRAPGHLRGPGLHRLGRHQPGLHPREPERQHAVHPHRVRLDDRRGPRQQDARCSAPSRPWPSRPSVCSSSSVTRTPTPWCPSPVPSRSTS